MKTSMYHYSKILKASATNKTNRCDAKDNFKNLTCIFIKYINLDDSSHSFYFHTAANLSEIHLSHKELQIRSVKNQVSRPEKSYTLRHSGGSYVYPPAPRTKPGHLASKLIARMSNSASPPSEAPPNKKNSQAHTPINRLQAQGRRVRKIRHCAQQRVLGVSDARARATLARTSS